MNNSFSFTCLLAFCSLGAACSASDSSSGPANPRVIEIETTIDTGGDITIRRAEFSYQSDKLKELRYFENGADDGRIEVSWANGRFATIAVVDPEGDRANYAWNYANDRVASVSYTVPSLSTIERSFEYDDTQYGREKQVTTVRSTVGQTATETAYQYFRYDQDDRLEEVDNIEGDDELVEDFSYDAQNRLERATRYRNNEHLDTHNFVYGGDGRLEEITNSDNERYSLLYDEVGRLRQSTHLDAGTTVTVRYTYASGSTAGFSLAPKLPFGELLDLRGNSFASIEIMHSRLDRPGDIARATNTGGGGGTGGGDTGGGDTGGGGTGGGGADCSIYTVQSACDSCLFDMCCEDLLQCENSLACTNYLDCEDTCTDSYCVDDCRYAHPTGASEIDAFRYCAADYCGSPCDL